jgi:hypothetical protein
MMVAAVDDRDTNVVPLRASRRLDVRLKRGHGLVPVGLGFSRAWFGATSTKTYRWAAVSAVGRLTAVPDIRLGR